MREIEYRAWLKGERKMVEVKTIHFGTRKIMYGYSAGVQNYGNASCGFDGCEIMQFTGLKDESGVKIYEGDIVKMLNIDEYPMQIKWSEEWARFIFYNLVDKKEMNLFTEQCEVIGNIYDNPELIKESE